MLVIQVRIHWLALLFFCLSLSSIQAQNWRQQMDHVDSLYSVGQLKQAYESSKKSLLQAEKELGKTHVSYGYNLCAIGQFLQELGDLPQAESVLKEGVQIIKQSASPDGEEYSYGVALLGMLYGAHNKVAESFVYLNEVLQVRQRLYGTESNGYAEILGVLAGIHSSTGNYELAVVEMQQVLAIRAKLYGENHPLYAESASTLGTLYVNADEYVKAEPLLDASLRIRETTFGKDNMNYWLAANNLAALKSRMGDYRQAISLETDILGRMQTDYQQTDVYLSTLNLLAGDYFQLKQYQQADSVYTVAQLLLENTIGKNHVRYSDALEGKTVLREQTGALAEAEKLCRQAADICQRTIGIQNDPYLSKARRLAGIYARMGQHAKADSIYTVLIPLSDQVMGRYSLSSAQLHSDQLVSYQLQQRSEKAIALLAEVAVRNESILQQQMPYWAPLQRDKYLGKHLSMYWSNLSVALSFHQSADVAGTVYKQSLLLKNLLLTQQTSALSAIRSTKNSAWTSAYQAIQDTKNLLATQYTLPVDQRKNLDSLETKVEILEKELARQSAPFRQAQNDLHVRWEDIRNALKPHEAAVEFVSFPFHNGREQTDTTRYLALVLRPNDKAPQLVPLLSDEAPLRQLLAHRKGAALYAARGSEIDSDQLSKGDSLYRLIWQPIDRLLADTKTVYVSPAGLLHQVAFAALPYRTASDKAPRFLIDRYQIRQVSSTRQIATQIADVSYQDIQSAQLYGGIQYDSTGVTNTGIWPFLPGTQQEVAAIGQLIGAKARTVSGPDATETSVKTLSGQSSSIVHLATHGFSFPDPAVSPDDTAAGGAAFRRIANPLFRTGVLMAGANQAWLGRRVSVGQDDGILTAYEVSNLNLSQTKLVVLSACETALGDIRGSEGVFGLQRAFKMAGVRYLLMSLWPVSDQATSTLMTQFYRNWQTHKTIRQAFQRTQSQLRRQYPPAVWASFVLVE